MIHSGGCQCGAVRFTVTGEPVRAMACHCTTCKLRSGSPYGIGVYFKEEQMELSGGQVQTFTFSSDTSGRWIKNEFCAACGATFSWTLEMRPGLRAIAGGSFDDPDWFKLNAHIWTQSARSDMCYPEDMATFPQALT